MYSFTCVSTVCAGLDQVWGVWTDPDGFPRWDPREERARLDGPFAVGSTLDSKQKGNPGGTATITAVEDRRRWTVKSPLPGGSLVIDHAVAPTADGRVTVEKRYDVTGPWGLLFRLYDGPRVRASMPASFAALEAEAARRG